MKASMHWTILGTALLGRVDFSSASYYYYPPPPVVSSTSSAASATPNPNYPTYGSYPSQQPYQGPPFGGLPDIEIEIDETPFDGNITGNAELLLSSSCFLGSHDWLIPLVTTLEDFDKDFNEAIDDFSKNFDFSFPDLPDDIKDFFPDDFDFDNFNFPDDLKSIFPDSFDFDNFFPPGFYPDGYSSPSASPTPTSKKQPPKTTLVTITLPAQRSGSYVYSYSFPKTTSTPSY